MLKFACLTVNASSQGLTHTVTTAMARSGGRYSCQQVEADGWWDFKYYSSWVVLEMTKGELQNT